MISHIWFYFCLRSLGQALAADQPEELLGWLTKAPPSILLLLLFKCAFFCVVLNYINLPDKMGYNFGQNSSL